MQKSAWLFAALALFALRAAADGAAMQCVARAGAPRAHLLELYTSEGCSSCPPAESWLQHLPASANVAALEFHVDYWDSPGWRDRFADARYTSTPAGAGGA